MSESELKMLLQRLEGESALSTTEALAVAEAVLAIAQRESIDRNPQLHRHASRSRLVEWKLMEDRKSVV